ncbi:MAG: hypothetical protein MI921_30050, partial [Cytophagales bacterium]|nr:hypothetical protein [Cytophagales bacterium]
MKFKFRHILVGLTVVFGLARSHNAFAQLPSIINISTTKASCDGVSDATLTVEFDGGNLPLSVAILGPDFLFLTYKENGPGPGPFTHTFTGLPDGRNGSGIGNYTVALEDSLGNRINGFTVINDTEPILITANSITDVCPPSLGAINLSVSGGTAPYSLVWSGPTAILNDELSPTGLAPGSYSVDVTDANGCTASLNNMVVEDSPVATLSGDATICEGENTNLTVIISGGTGPFNITIDNGVGTINGYNSGDPILVSPGANTTYNLLGPLTDANGCEASLNGSATVTVNPLPDATITPAGPFCEDAAPVNLVAATPGGTWSGPGITDGVNGTFDPSVAGSASSPHTITYEITDGNGCIGTDTEDIVVNAVPDATITPAGPFCEDAAPVNLVAATPGGTWSGPGITDGANGTFDPSVAGSALSPHTITYEINDGNGCIDTDTEAIVVNALPDATITPAGPFCEDAAPVNLVAATPGGTWSGPGITDGVNGTFDPSVAG